MRIMMMLIISLLLLNCLSINIIIVNQLGKDDDFDSRPPWPLTKKRGGSLVHEFIRQLIFSALRSKQKPSP